MSVEKSRLVELTERDWDIVVACLLDRSAASNEVPRGAMTVWSAGANRCRYIVDQICAERPCLNANQPRDGTGGA